MKILITGGTGYIGSHVALALSKAGYDIVLLDNLSNSQADVVLSIERILNKKIIFYKVDVRDTDKLVKILQEAQIKAVIHCAGLKAVGDSSTIPIEYYSCNVVGSINLIKAMNSVGVKTLVFSSSATVYGNPQYLPYDEEHPTLPTNPYGRNKLQIEQFLEDVVNSDSKWSIISLRYFNPVGAHESGQIGENPKGRPNNLMPIVANVAIGKIPMLNIFGNDYKTIDGTGMRDYIHVMDLADGHLKAVEWILNNKGYHVFNLGSGTSHSVLQLVHEFEKISGKNIPRKFVNRRDGDLAIYYAQSDKALRFLNWKTKRGLREMCESSWKWMLQHSK